MMIQGRTSQPQQAILEHVNQNYHTFCQQFTKFFDEKQYGEAENLLHTNRHAFAHIFSQNKPFDAMIERFVDEGRYNDARLLATMLSNNGCGTIVTASFLIGVYCYHDNVKTAKDLIPEFQERFPKQSVTSQLELVSRVTSHKQTADFCQKACEVFQKNFGA